MECQYSKSLPQKLEVKGKSRESNGEWRNPNRGKLEHPKLVGEKMNVGDNVTLKRKNHCFRRRKEKNRRVLHQKMPQKTPEVLDIYSQEH